MNIKSVANNFLAPEIKKLKRERKTESSTDRDPTQDQSGKNDQTPKRNLTEEELNSAISFLKELKGVKDNNLSVRLAKENDVPVVFIEDALGKIIRRIPETELSLLTQKEKSKGNLLDKSL